jgi:cyclic pyranopterin phosphate synthase
MINVGGKETTLRIAHARCYVEMPEYVMQKLLQTAHNNILTSKKGPIETTAIIGGIMAAKKTHDLIPFCHPVPLDNCEITVNIDENRKNSLRIDCIATTHSKTGVEMEAFVGASNSALCVYDMCKAISHDIKITDLQLMSKTGGKRDFQRTIDSQRTL